MAKKSKGKGRGAARGKVGDPTANRLAQKVTTARGRPISSTRWLQRQLNDPYVKRAKAEGYRSRAAYKLIEMDERFEILKPGARVIDLGATPGGWTQVAVAKVGAKGGVKRGKVVAVDFVAMEPVAGADFLELDFLDDDAEARIAEALGGAADVILSDMAAPSTGVARVDHLRIMGLCEVALDFACGILAADGAFVAKVLRGGGEAELVALLKKNFRRVKHVKPPASRSDSAEMYVVATGFRGADSS
jgi:23S rRNA (uridine2552-2'-O)-methyltransferase